MMMADFEIDVALVGGCGHVGLPLGVALANTGLRVTLVDTSDIAVQLVSIGEAPFEEPGLGDVLRTVLGRGMISATTDPKEVYKARTIIVIIGTPVDEHQNPEPHKVLDAIRELIPFMRSGQQLILRSTLYPGTTALVEGMLHEENMHVGVSFCPERIAEGKAMQELYTLPQIVSARTDDAFQHASELFGRLTLSVVRLSPEEAELAKLFTNTWRYIKFAAANQLFMMAQNFGLDYERIRQGLRHDYPRAADLPSAGFAAGPCLLKDTLQLAAFNNNDFILGHAAINVNEGFPLYVVSQLAQRYDLSAMTIGILGMAFKGESDDIRSSLAYKLKRILRYRARGVLTADPYVKADTELVPEEELIQRSDLVIIGAPHIRYRELVIPGPIIDVWALRGEASGI